MFYCEAYLRVIWARDKTALVRMCVCVHVQRSLLGDARFMVAEL